MSKIRSFKPKTQKTVTNNRNFANQNNPNNSSYNPEIKSQQNNFQPKTNRDKKSQNSFQPKNNNYSKGHRQSNPLRQDFVGQPSERLQNNDRTDASSYMVFQSPKAGGHDAIKVISLGGVGNVTRNMYVYEYKDDIVIIDCGVGFPEDDMLGVDLVIPDITYLRDKKSKIKGIIVSHGHEDHIGGLPFIWQELDVPIYTQKLTAGFIRSKFIEHNLPKDKINVMDINDTVKLGAFDISFYRVSHSVPDATGIVMRTPLGILVHQSDFKIDWTPVNDQIPDLQTVAAIGKEGVLYLAIDSLGVERPGMTPTEITIEDSFRKIEAATQGKMLITTTSSNVTRIQQAINIAAESGRKIALSGRSMENNFQVARDLGYLDVPNGLIIAQDAVKKVPDNKLMIIVAGSQGQPGSSLSRIANFDHRFIRVTPKDTIVFSASPIPGSEANQNNLIDRLVQVGCRVYAAQVDGSLHVSGHAAQEEIKLMIKLLQPKFLLPIGGGYRQMQAFSTVCQKLGYDAKDVIIPQEGDVIEVSKSQVRMDGRVEIQNVYVDGLGVGDVGNVVLRDRQVMSEEGIVVVMVPFDHQRQQVTAEPDIISRGFVFEKTSEDLLDAGLEVVKSILKDYKKADQKSWDWKYLRSQIEKNLEKFFYQETNRRPLILTVVANL